MQVSPETILLSGNLYLPISSQLLTSRLQVPRITQKSVCIPVTVVNPRQECVKVPRTECEVVETAGVEEACTVVPASLPAQQQCDYQVYISRQTILIMQFPLR